MNSGRTLTRARGLVLILAIGLVFWMRWQGGAPPVAPPPSSPAATEAPASSSAAKADGHDLSNDEKLGGHTLARHVGRSDDDLRARLKAEPGISAASTYTDRETAERVVAATLARERKRVDSWLARQGSRPNLALDYRGAPGDVIGRSLRRGSATSRPCVDAVVVLRSHRDGGFIVLTSYPEAR